MKEIKEYVIWEKEEYYYAGSGEFIPTIHSYLHEDDEIRPAVLVVPGGAYAILTVGEAGNVAKEFYDRGYQAFVLSYTNNVTLSQPLGMQPLKDISRAVRYIRHFAAQFCVNQRQLAVMGFSAGGHLAGSLAIYYDLDELKESGEYAEDSNRPDTVLLNYAVISALEPYRLKGVFENIVGEHITEEQKEYLSLEKNIRSDMPPVFLSQGLSDTLCPAEPALSMVETCRRAGVDVEAHFWKNVEHGYASKTRVEECENSLYVYQQLYQLIQQMSEEEFAGYKDLFGSLKKGMSFEDFCQAVLSETMVNIYVSCMKPDAESPEKPPKSLVHNPNENFWAELEDNWMRLEYKEVMMS